jgi:hypothetical protein
LQKKKAKTQRRLPNMADLGDIVKDRISGLVGVCTAKASYLYAGPQVLVVPRESKDGQPVSGTWLDESRTEVTCGVPLEKPVGYRPPTR